MLVLCNVKKGICKSSDDGFANHRRLLTQLNYPSCSAECRFARTPRAASSSSSITGTHEAAALRLRNAWMQLEAAVIVVLSRSSDLA